MSSAERQLFDPLTDRYAGRLSEYLADQAESALKGAYELGRQAIDDGLGVLDLAAAHQTALARALLSAATAAEREQMSVRAWGFFSESLAPFEMTQRGFREANLKLQSLNERLEERAAELIRANEQLEARNIAVERERATLAAVMGVMSRSAQCFHLTALIASSISPASCPAARAAACRRRAFPLRQVE